MLAAIEMTYTGRVPRAMGMCIRPINAIVKVPMVPAPSPEAAGLAEERFPDLLLDRRGSEDDDPVADLELRVAVGPEDLAVPDDRADVRGGRETDGLHFLVGRG